MSTFTKEQLIEQAKKNIEVLRGAVEKIHGASDAAVIHLKLAEITLASLEADVVCVIDQSNLDYLKSGSDADVWPASRAEMGDVLLYRSATPAPVSVPAAMEMDDDFDSAFEHGKAVGWNAYRAAMLQSFGNSEQLNSPVIPDGWVACSERMPDNDDFVYIWPRPDFGVELHVAQYGKFDKRDAGWYAQVYEQNYGIEYYPIKVTHWMALPAAPQQEA